MVSDACREPTQENQEERKPTQDGRDALLGEDAHPAMDLPRENKNRYPRRESRRRKNFGDEFLCKLKEGNYFVSLLTKSQDVLLESIDHLKCAENDLCGATKEQVGSIPENETSNVNVS